MGRSWFELCVRVGTTPQISLRNESDDGTGHSVHQTQMVKSWSDNLYNVVQRAGTGYTRSLLVCMHVRCNAFCMHTAASLHMHACLSAPDLFDVASLHMFTVSCRMLYKYQGPDSYRGEGIESLFSSLVR